MALNMTKIAFRVPNLPALQKRLENMGPEAKITTRYCPKRADEMVGGSLFWIIDHALVGRTPIRGFHQREEDGRWEVQLEPRLIPVHPRLKRAHQGWRYLAADDAPRDLADGEDIGEMLPGRLMGKLQKLGLI
ncbi:DUF1489 family protein [Altererythrobacter sp. SALINAS58]|uniref:DUF1489 family protein n=1 Tax=Alteripontixanthobacter muriae TaxID=2705546 RepID=UPI00157551A6|nr:DUF1489 family protein [Alteripontixanthobacter muriae]NTZ42758.1 DUF1489 family protein [Alteripontixanthobacter muriae]